MRLDIQSAARRLFDIIDVPRGVVGVLAWPDITHPSIRVFVVPGFKLPVSAVPTEFDGFPVEIETRGDVIPLHQYLRTQPSYSIPNNEASIDGKTEATIEEMVGMIECGKPRLPEMRRR